MVFFVEDAVNEQEALSCSQEPSGGSRLYGSPSTERAVGEQQMNASLSETPLLYKDQDDKLPLCWYLLVLNRLRRCTHSRYSHRQGSNSASIRLLKALKAFLHRRALLGVLEGSNFIVDTAAGTRSLYSWLEQGAGHVQGQLAQLVLVHAVPLEFPSAANSVTGKVPHVSKSMHTSVLTFVS